MKPKQLMCAEEYCLMFDEKRPSLPGKLLVVAGDPGHRDELPQRLGGRGYDVEVARNAPDALAKIDQAHYDLVLLDPAPQDAGGLDMLRLLRATYSQSELPVITVAAGEDGHSVAERIQSQLARAQAERESTAADPITGLSHRGYFLRRLGQQLARRRTARHEPLAVLRINLDAFKMLNDSYGHQAGDQVLAEAAARMRDALTEESVLARIGGDEFAVLLASGAFAANPEMAARRLLSSLTQPFSLPGTCIPLSASIGIAVFTGDDTAAINLLSDADLALSCSKQHGPNRWERFEPKMRARAQARLTLSIDLRHAIERDQLVAFYQPKIDLATRKIVGFEALLRWRHPVLGLVQPNDFIPIAEHTGVIVPIGAWILREACLQLKSWHARFLCDPPLSMSVNLSVKQLKDPELVACVQGVLAETGIPPACLNLELTESSLAHDIEAARDVLARIQALNVGLKLDDFGTGYSSLSYLQQLRFDSLKIDRSFVDRLESDTESHAIVETILNLARTLHMTVVAEGIETEEQLAKLVDLGCAMGQGFLFSKPVAAELAEQLLTPAFVN